MNFFSALILCCALTCAHAAQQHCTDPCTVGQHGLGSILSRRKGKDLCKDYAARVIDADFARECGHADLAKALALCGNLGKNMPAQCYLHEAAGVGIVVAQTGASISIWLPIVWKILQMRTEKLK